MRLKKQKGFTLIELLVVISVISFLASIILVSVKNARIRAKHVNSYEVFNTLNQAIQLYQQDHGYYPPATDQTVVWTNASGGNWNQLLTSLNGYLQNPNIYNLPFVGTGGTIYQGYMYAKGTEQSHKDIQYYDGNQYLGCLTLYDGYELAATFDSEQDNYTLHDGGFDPDALDFAGGHFSFGPTCQ